MRVTKRKSSVEIWNTYKRFVPICKAIPNKISLASKILGYSCLSIALFPNGLGFVFYPLAIIFLGRKEILRLFKAIKGNIKYYTIKYKRLYFHK